MGFHDKWEKREYYWQYLSFSDFNRLQRTIQVLSRLYRSSRHHLNVEISIIIKPVLDLDFKIIRLIELGCNLKMLFRYSPQTIAFQHKYEC